jgi:hypothetical protein
LFLCAGCCQRCAANGGHEGFALIVHDVSNIVFSNLRAKIGNFSQILSKIL